MATQRTNNQPNESAVGTPYILYHNYYSICSIMMRYLVRIRGEPGDVASKMNIEIRDVDIFNEEQFSEEYLTKVNPNGQVRTVYSSIGVQIINQKGKVPVLGSSAAFSFPLNQTSKISTYIAERHPSLLPQEFAAEIVQLINKMHELNFFTLSFRGSPTLASGFADAALKRLDDKSISDEYRKALKYKLIM